VSSSSPILIGGKPINSIDARSKNRASSSSARPPSTSSSSNEESADSNDSQQSEQVEEGKTLTGKKITDKF